MPCFCSRRSNWLRDLAVHPPEDLVEEFDDRDLRAEARPDRTDFQPDDAAADDDEMAGDLGELQRAGRGHDGLFIDIDIDARDAAGVASQWQ